MTVHNIISKGYTTKKINFTPNWRYKYFRLFKLKECKITIIKDYLPVLTIETLTKSIVIHALEQFKKFYITVYKFKRVKSNEQYN